MASRQRRREASPAPSDDSLDGHVMEDLEMEAKSARYHPTSSSQTPSSSSTTSINNTSSHTPIPGHRPHVQTPLRPASRGVQSVFAQNAMPDYGDDSSDDDEKKDTSQPTSHVYNDGPITQYDEDEPGPPPTDEKSDISPVPSGLPPVPPTNLGTSKSRSVLIPKMVDTEMHMIPSTSNNAMNPIPSTPVTALASGSTPVSIASPTSSNPSDRTGQQANRRPSASRIRPPPAPLPAFADAASIASAIAGGGSPEKAAQTLLAVKKAYANMQREAVQREIGTDSTGTGQGMYTAGLRTSTPSETSGSVASTSSQRPNSRGYSQAYRPPTPQHLHDYGEVEKNSGGRTHISAAASAILSKLKSSSSTSSFNPQEGENSEVDPEVAAAAALAKARRRSAKRIREQIEKGSAITISPFASPAELAMALANANAKAIKNQQQQTTIQQASSTNDASSNAGPSGKSTDHRPMIMQSSTKGPGTPTTSTNTNVDNTEERPQSVSRSSLRRSSIPSIPLPHERDGRRDSTSNVTNLMQGPGPVSMSSNHHVVDSIYGSSHPTPTSSNPNGVSKLINGRATPVRASTPQTDKPRLPPQGLLRPISRESLNGHTNAPNETMTTNSKGYHTNHNTSPVGNDGLPKPSTPIYSQNPLKPTFIPPPSSNNSHSSQPPAPPLGLPWPTSSPSTPQSQLGSGSTLQLNASTLQLLNQRRQSSASSSSSSSPPIPTPVHGPSTPHTSDNNNNNPRKPSQTLDTRANAPSPTSMLSSASNASASSVSSSVSSSSSIQSTSFGARTPVPSQDNRLQLNNNKSTKPSPIVSSKNDRNTPIPPSSQGIIAKPSPNTGPGPETARLAKEEAALLNDLGAIDATLSQLTRAGTTIDDSHAIPTNMSGSPSSVSSAPQRNVNPAPTKRPMPPSHASVKLEMALNKVP